MSLVDFLSYGISKAELSSIIIYTLCMTHITIVAVTVFLHRCQAHRSLQLSPAISHFFRFWLWLTTGMVTKEWAAIHRKHLLLTRADVFRRIMTSGRIPVKTCLLRRTHAHTEITCLPGLDRSAGLGRTWSCLSSLGAQARGGDGQAPAFRVARCHTLSEAWV